MIAAIQIILGVAVWGGALWGALQIATLHTSWEHAACGVWGCGPPATALVSCHLAWLIALAPIAIAGKRWLPDPWRRKLGIALASLAAAIVVGVVLREATTWLPAASEYQRKFFAQRCLFVLATWIDVPLVQVAAVGWYWSVGATFRSRKAISDRNSSVANNRT